MAEHRFVRMECACGNPWHSVQFTLDDWDDGHPPELSCTPVLTPAPFLTRIRYAFRYLFNAAFHDPEYAYEAAMFLPEDAERLRELLEEFLNKQPK